MGSKSVLLAVAITVALAGCSRSTNALSVNTQAPPQPLPSTPSGSLQSAELQELPPANEPIQSEVPKAPEAPTIGNSDTSATESIETASLEQPEITNKPITHDAMAGSWNVNTDNPGCRLIMSFTRWSGGYRAATLRCNSSELASVSAWDVKNNRVVLVDTNGNQVATMGSAGSERYSGSMVGGKPITLSR